MANCNRLGRHLPSLKLGPSTRGMKTSSLLRRRPSMTWRAQSAGSVMGMRPAMEARSVEMEFPSFLLYFIRLINCEYVLTSPSAVVNSSHFEGCHFQHWGTRSKEQYALKAADKGILELCDEKAPKEWQDSLPRRDMILRCFFFYHKVWTLFKSPFSLVLLSSFYGTSLFSEKRHLMDNKKRKYVTSAY